MKPTHTHTHTYIMGVSHLEGQLHIVLVQDEPRIAHNHRLDHCVIGQRHGYVAADEQEVTRAHDVVHVKAVGGLCFALPRGTRPVLRYCV